MSIEHAENKIVPLLPLELQIEFDNMYQKLLEQQKIYYRRIKAKSSETSATASGPDAPTTTPTPSAKKRRGKSSATSSSIPPAIPQAAPSGTKRTAEETDESESASKKPRSQLPMPTDFVATPLVTSLSTPMQPRATPLATSSSTPMPQPTSLAAEIDRIVGSDSFPSAINGAGMYSEKRSKIVAELLDNKYSDQDVADYINSFDNEPDDTKQFTLIHKGLNDRRRYPVWRHLSLKAKYSYARRGKQAPRPVTVFSSTPQAMPGTKRTAEETGERESASKSSAVCRPCLRIL